MNKALIGRAVYGCAFLAVAQAAGTGAWARLSPSHLGHEPFPRTDDRNGEAQRNSTGADSRITHQIEFLSVELEKFEAETRGISERN